MERAHKSNAPVLLALLAAAFAVAAIWRRPRSRGAARPRRPRPGQQPAGVRVRAEPGGADSVGGRLSGPSGRSWRRFRRRLPAAPAARPVRTDPARRTSKRSEANAGAVVATAPASFPRQLAHDALLAHVGTKAGRSITLARWTISFWRGSATTGEICPGGKPRSIRHSSRKSCCSSTASKTWNLLLCSPFRPDQAVRTAPKSGRFGRFRTAAVRTLFARSLRARPPSLTPACSGS